MSLACLFLAAKPDDNDALEKGEMGFRGILRLYPFVHAGEVGSDLVRLERCTMKKALHRDGPVMGFQSSSTRRVRCCR
jgi:hypothetical protein